ncbi:MAG TPA: HAD-IIB family hydrolase [Candidatus Paceibacterota bacterium]
MNANYKLIVFDLDGTLAESKAVVPPEISNLLCQLLVVKKVAVISGGSFTQFERQLLKHISCKDEMFENLYLLPTSGGDLYKFEEGEWHLVASHELGSEDKKKIKEGIVKGLSSLSFALPEKTYGEQVEDRDSQITFSALGQQAPVEIKKAWDPDHSKRAELASRIKEYLPEFEVKVGGSTSVDITKRGLNKAWAVGELMTRLGFDKHEVLYVGDDLFPGGNDYVVTSLGISTHSVAGPVDSASIIRELIVP